MERLLGCAGQIAARRNLAASIDHHLDQPSVALDDALVRMVEHAVEASGHVVHRMSSGAGHDAMILARRMPAAMLFLRSPGGISHNPAESVLPDDVAAALRAGASLLRGLEHSHG